MSEVLNVQDECDILDILVKKIITNLKCWGDDDMILVSFLRFKKLKPKYIKSEKPCNFCQNWQWAMQQCASW